MAKRLRLGAQVDGTHGLRCSLPGKNVDTAADGNDMSVLSFNSEWANDYILPVSAGLIFVPPLGGSAYAEAIYTHPSGYCFFEGGRYDGGVYWNSGYSTPVIFYQQNPTQIVIDYFGSGPNSTNKSGGPPTTVYIITWPIPLA